MCARPLITSTLLIVRVAGRWDPAGGGCFTRGSARSRALLTDSEFVDDRAVAFEVGLLQIIEKTAPAADELEQPAAAVVVFGVSLEVLGQIADPVRKQRNLHFR